MNEFVQQIFKCLPWAGPHLGIGVSREQTHEVPSVEMLRSGVRRLIITKAIIQPEL